MKPADRLRQSLLHTLRREVDRIKHRPQGSTWQAFSSDASPAEMPRSIDPEGLVFRNDFASGHVLGRTTLMQPGSELLILLQQLLCLSAAPWNPSERPLRPEDLLFFDLETTGLSRDTSTLPFLIGLGFWLDVDRATFRVDQLFLQDPSQEPRALQQLRGYLERARVLISFNGRSFDAPLLKNRLMLNRESPCIDDIAHLDLLPPCRRMFRQRLTNCRLGTLERDLLGFHRHNDLDGSEAPRVYNDWLRTGHPGDLPLLLEHNKLDVLLMAPLLDQVVRHAMDPLHWAEDGEELLGCALMHVSVDPSLAEACLRRGLELARTPTTRRRLLSTLARHLRRRGQRQEASALWDQFRKEFPQHDAGWIELAKYHEHVTRDLHRALELAERCPLQHLDQHQHRLRRLRRRVQRVLANRNRGM
jgi:uncharacterized protein YprB with RNaseH-like and TPR domain